MPSAHARVARQTLLRCDSAHSSLRKWRVTAIHPRGLPQARSNRLSLSTSRPTCNSIEVAGETACNVGDLSFEHALHAQHTPELMTPIVEKLSVFKEAQDPDNSSIGQEAPGAAEVHHVFSNSPRSRTYFKKINLSAGLSTRGTSRDLNELWQANQPLHNVGLTYLMPWLPHIETDPTDPPLTAIERLGVEIRAFEKYCTPSLEEQKAVDNVLNELKRVIREHDESLVVDVIGSRATGLADPLSDFDINIYSSKNPDLSDAEMSRKILSPLYKRLKYGPRLFRDLTYIKQAKVPIVLGQHNLAGILVQFQSTPRSQPTREYVQSAMIKHPTLKPLFKLLKQALQMRGLTVGSSGGITSYPLLNMIVASLQFSATKNTLADVGNDFMAFLSFYSDFDFGKHGISTNPLELFEKGAASQWEADTGQEDTQQFSAKQPSQNNNGSHKTSHVIPRKRLRSYRMTLQDPADAINDLGKTCYQIQDVQATLVAIRAAIRRNISLWDGKSRRVSPNGRNTRFAILKPCLSGDYRIYEHERAELRTFARNAAASSATTEKL
jgi:hypothetical protein